MARVTVEIDLPDELVDQAEKMDMLDPDSLSLLVRYELENYLAAEDEYQIEMPPEYEDWLNQVCSDPTDTCFLDDVFEDDMADAALSKENALP